MKYFLEIVTSISKVNFSSTELPGGSQRHETMEEALLEFDAIESSTEDDDLVPYVIYSEHEDGSLVLEAKLGCFAFVKDRRFTSVNNALAYSDKVDKPIEIFDFDTETYISTCVS